MHLIRTQYAPSNERIGESFYVFMARLHDFKGAALGLLYPLWVSANAPACLLEIFSRAVRLRGLVTHVTDSQKADNRSVPRVVNDGLFLGPTLIAGLTLK